jgi:hypothetical protein
MGAISDGAHQSYSFCDYSRVSAVSSKARILNVRNIAGFLSRTVIAKRKDCQQVAFAKIQPSAVGTYR